MSYLWDGLQYLLEDEVKIVKMKEDMVGNSIFMGDLMSNHFISDEIREFINRNWDGLGYVKYRYVINNNLRVEWNVVQLVKNGNNYELDDRILRIIYGLYKNSRCYREDKCELLEVGFWNTPFIKYLPVEGEMDFIHINSGCTYNFGGNNIGKIYIWREQEWLKTLFHEVVHGFKYDMELRHFGFCCSDRKLGNESYVEWMGILMTLLYFSESKVSFKRNYVLLMKQNKKNSEEVKGYYFKNRDLIRVNLLGYFILVSYFWEMGEKMLNGILKDRFKISKEKEDKIRRYLIEKYKKDEKKYDNLNENNKKDYVLCVLPVDFIKRGK